MVSNTELTAKRLGISISTYSARSAKEVESAVAAMIRDRVEAVIVLPDAFFSNQRSQLVNLADAARLPTMFWTR